MRRYEGHVVVVTTDTGEGFKGQLRRAYRDSLALGDAVKLIPRSGNNPAVEHEIAGLMVVERAKVASVNVTTTD